MHIDKMQALIISAPFTKSELARNLVPLTFKSFQPNLFTFHKILKTWPLMFKTLSIQGYLI